MITITNESVIQGFLNVLIYFSKLFRSIGKRYIVIVGNRVYSTDRVNEVSSGNFLGDLDIIISNQFSGIFPDKSQSIVTKFYRQHYALVLDKSFYVIDLDDFYKSYKALEKDKRLKSVNMLRLRASNISMNGFPNVHKFNSFSFMIDGELVIDSDGGLFKFKNNLPKIITLYGIADSYLLSNRYGPTAGLVHTEVLLADEVQKIFDSDAPTSLHIQMNNGISGDISISKNLIPKAFLKGLVSLNLYSLQKNDPMYAPNVYILTLVAGVDDHLGVVDAKTIFIQDEKPSIEYGSDA